MSGREKESFLLEIINEQDFLEFDFEPIEIVCRRIIGDAGVKTGRLGIVLVESETSRQYNRDYLQHDYATDVISFPIEDRLDEGHLEGEILVCTQVAGERADEFNWTPVEEALLYVVHGVLHLVGFDDTTDRTREVMRQKEKEYLAAIGISVPQWNWDDDDGGDTTENGHAGDGAGWN